MGGSEVFKNQGFKNPLFSSSRKKIKLKSWLNLNAIIVFFMNKVIQHAPITHMKKNYMKKQCLFSMTLILPKNIETFNGKKGHDKKSTVFS